VRVGETRYIALPTHPHYGHPVRVIRQLTEKEHTGCLIEDLTHPGFHFHILAHWLSALPQGATKGQVDQAPIILPLAALDKLVQLLLGKHQQGRADHHDPAVEPTQCTPVAAVASCQPNPTQPLPLLYDPQADRRNTP